MNDRYIQGHRQGNLAKKSGNFIKCVAGIPIKIAFINLIAVTLIAIIMGFFNSLIIGQTIATLIEKQSLELSEILISLLFLILLTPASVLLIAFLFTYSFNFGRLGLYFASITNILGCTIMLIQAIQNPVLIFVFDASLLVLSFIISKQAWDESSGWKWLKNSAIYCGAIGGTSFYGMDLTNAVFDGADLRNTDLRETILNHASFVGTKNLELARIKGTILEDKRVRDLLVNPKIDQQKDFNYADFTGANLRDAALEGANFSGVNFQGASLQNANLAAADLTGVNAIDTDFSGAILHDICIQDWNVSKKTNFKNVQCRRVFLKQNQQEPKPDSGFFAEGEFEKWITDVRDTIDLIFQNGLNLRSLAFAITQVSIDHEDTQLTVESFAHKGDGVVVVKLGLKQTLDSFNPPTPPAIIHAAVTQEYGQAQQAISAGYELVLRAKDEEIARLTYRLEVSDQQMHGLHGLIACIAQTKESSSVTINKYYSTQQGDIMEGQKIQAGGNVEQGNRITAGGDFNSTGSNINLDEQNGNVNICLQQLQDIQTSSSQELVKALASLQNAINEDTTISEVKKGELLEKVKVLAEEGKKEEKQREKNIVEKALAGIQSINEWLGSGSKLVQACQTYLPTISKIFGI
jgi:uncharacterized protein YjbI with pentapeptide repeats